MARQSWQALSWWYMNSDPSEMGPEALADRIQSYKKQKAIDSVKIMDTFS